MSTPADRLRLLLVEDEPDDADILRELLAAFGAGHFRLHHVETLQEGFECIDAGGIDLVLLDLSLPDSHGVDTLTRTLEHRADLPIIVLTGLDDERLGTQLVQAGAQDYLVKGHFDGRLLVRCLRYAVERHRMLEKLERANVVKTYFAATMSHELRNTIFAITSYCDLALDPRTQHMEAEKRRILGLVNDRAKQSLRLIQATLELTRAEVTASKLEEHEVSVNELIDELAGETEIPAAQRGKVALRWEVASSLPPLHTDPVKLKMVLKNLVENAIKFTEEGSVAVSAGAANGDVRFSVADTGIGIPADELQNLFEPFRQAHGKTSRGAGGAGLGLYIVHRLVELLGGSITVASDSHQGSTFSVSIPLRQLGRSVAR